MPAHSTRAIALRQADLVHRSSPAEVKPVNRKLVLLRNAIDESRIKHAAIAHALKVSPQYLSMLLSGEKTWTIKHQDDLPDEIECIHSRLQAEAFGHIVVTPTSTDEQSLRSIAAGLFGLFRSRLPEKASRMAKATLPATEGPRSAAVACCASPDGDVT